MRIDLLPTEAWDRANEIVSKAWGPREGETLRVQGGLGVSVFETTLGLAQIFSHKRAIGIVKGNTPAFEHVLSWFLKETYEVQSAKIEDLQTPEAIKAWVSGLKKETALVLLAEDHPVTGQTWDWDFADQTLNESKIFCIRVSHSAFLSQQNPLRPFSARLCSLSENISLAFFGSRLKIPPMVSHRQALNPDEVVRRISDRRAEGSDQKSIEALEKSFSQFRLFAEGSKRLFDRAVLCFPDVGGDALLGELARRWGQPGLLGTQMDTAHQCRWDSSRLFKGWWHQIPGEEQLRGMVTFAPSLIARKDFAKDLRDAYEGLKKLQSW